MLKFALLPVLALSMLLVSCAGESPGITAAKPIETHVETRVVSPEPVANSIPRPAPSRSQQLAVAATRSAPPGEIAPLAVAGSTARTATAAAGPAAATTVAASVTTTAAAEPAASTSVTTAVSIEPGIGTRGRRAVVAK